jgi:hypothetical protein
LLKVNDKEESYALKRSMLIIRDSQIRQMAVSFLDRLIVQTLKYLRTDYPNVASEKNDEEILSDFKLLTEDLETLNFQQEDNLMEYLVMCIRYNTNHETLMQNSQINKVLCNPDNSENEKVYLMNQILQKHES